MVNIFAIQMKMSHDSESYKFNKKNTKIPKKIQKIQRHYSWKQMANEYMKDSSTLHVIK